MADELLPAELFMRGELWFVAQVPITQSPLEMVQKIVFETEPSGDKYVPIFTNDAVAEAYIAVSLRCDLEAFTCRLRQGFGAMHDALAVIGHTHVAFNPTRGTYAARLPIRSVADSLHRHLFPPGSAN